MSHRTQIILTDSQYASLMHEADRTGLSLAELVRRAVSREYGFPDPTALLAALTESFGAWEGDTPDGAEYVKRLRPGLQARLDRTANP